MQTIIWKYKMEIFCDIIIEFNERNYKFNFDENTCFVRNQISKNLEKKQKTWQMTTLSVSVATYSGNLTSNDKLLRIFSNYKSCFMYTLSTTLFQLKLRTFKRATL